RTAGRVAPAAMGRADPDRAPRAGSVPEDRGAAVLRDPRPVRVLLVRAGTAAGGSWMTSTLPEGLEELLPGYLGGQRWYAGAEVPRAETVHVEHAQELWSGDEGHRLWHAVVAAGRDHYQVVLGERPAGERADFLHGHEEAVLGSIGDSYFYDATLDSELARSLLEAVSGGHESAKLARPIGAEQSNTSIV